MKLSPYAKTQRAQMRAAGIRPDPRPRFKIGDEVSREIGQAGGKQSGRVDFIGSFDATIGGYRYKVSDSSGHRTFWNEGTMTKVKTLSKAEQKKNAQWHHVHRAAEHLAGLLKQEKFPGHESQEAHELELWQENDRTIHNQQNSIETNLAKKIVAGKFDYHQSVKLWQYLADAAAQSYTREHGSGHGSSYGIFTVSQRHNLARRLAHDFATRFCNYILFGTQDLLSDAQKVIEKVKAK